MIHAKQHIAAFNSASLFKKLALVSMCLCFNVFFLRAQASCDTLYARIFYRLNDTRIDPSYLGNEVTLRNIDSLLTPGAGFEVTALQIVGHSSPEGTLEINRRLSRERGKTLYNYIATRYPQLVNHLQLTEPEDPESAPENEYPYLRTSLLRVCYVPARIRLAQAVYPSPQLLPGNEIPLPDITAPVVKVAPAIPADTLIKNTFFAVKTNLLFDALTALNVELEVPIANRYSVMVEDVFPWWETGNKYCFQMWEMGVEARYWFKPWEKIGTEKLRGWFAGFYGMSSIYDFQLDRSLNYQGEYWSAGISGGYAMPIGRRKRVNLEFSLGLGYLSTQYRHYLPTLSYDKLIRDRNHDGKASYWGPTKAKVSLVFPICFNAKGKEVHHD